MRRLAIIVSILLALGMTTLAAQTPTGWGEVVSYYRAALTQHRIVGSSLAVVQDGRIVAREYVGLRDQATGRLVDGNTVFHWASITKTFTAIAIMQLRDRGLVSLDDPIVRYVPELRKVSDPFGPVEAITLRHLLSHSSGFQSSTWTWTPGAAWEPFEPPGWEQLVGMMPYVRLEFAPGSKYSYSNPGFIYLGRVIESVMQEPFETYLDKEILRPLGMIRTFFDRAPSSQRDERSHSYFVTDAGTTEARFDFDTGITVANGGLNAPIDDMARYLGFLCGSSEPAVARQYETILKRSSLEEMWKPVVPVADGVSMGLGFFLEQHGGLDFVAHSGGQNGFISHFYVHVPSRRATIVAFNTQATSEKRGDERNTRALDSALWHVMMERLFGGTARPAPPGTPRS
jgi:CubicO group peptidase (beta-lactamase class C family)